MVNRHHVYNRKLSWNLSSDNFLGPHSDFYLAFERNHAFINWYFLTKITRSFKLLYDLQDRDDWPNFVAVYQRQDCSRPLQEDLDHKNVTTFQLGLNLSLVKIVVIPGICKYHFESSYLKKLSNRGTAISFIPDNQNGKKGLKNFIQIQISPLHSMFIRLQLFLLGIIGNPLKTYRLHYLSRGRSRL